MCAAAPNDCVAVEVSIMWARRLLLTPSMLSALAGKGIVGVNTVSSTRDES